MHLAYIQGSRWPDDHTDAAPNALQWVSGIMTHSCAVCQGMLLTPLLNVEGVSMQRLSNCCSMCVNPIASGAAQCASNPLPVATHVTSAWQLSCNQCMAMLCADCASPNHTRLHDNNCTFSSASELCPNSCLFSSWKIGPCLLLTVYAGLLLSISGNR